MIVDMDGRQLHVMIYHEDLYVPAVRWLERTRSGLKVENKIFVLKSEARNQGSGAAMLSKQVIALQKQGGGTIVAEAARGGQFVGYMAWPRMGYSGRLDASTKRELRKSNLPEKMRKATDVSQLMQTKAGQTWWRENGKNIDVKFVVKPGSPHVRALGNYIKEKGYDLPIPPT